MRASRKVRGTILTSLLLGTTSLSMAAYAQDDQSDSVETNEVDEIIVTAPNYVSVGGRSANKADIPLVETPQSVAVISRDMIDLLNFDSLNEAMRYVSGAVGEAFGPDERYDWLTVRGFDPVQFIDGVRAPIASVNNSGTDLYGFESVEILKGSASSLYGESPPGGIVNMTSRRPENDFSAELGFQAGEYNHLQFNGDITGPISDTVSVRLTALYRDRGTQVDFLDSERVYVAPAITFDFSPATSLTLLANFQEDHLDNQSTGFLPAFGTILPNPLGEVPVGRNLGETGVNFFDRKQYSVGYELVHEVNDWLTLEQNMKHFDVEVFSRAIYGAGLLDADFDGVPDDYRTVIRYDFPFNEDIKTTSVDSRANLKFDTGALEHAMIVGVDYRHYNGYSEFGFSLAPSIDLFDPVYDAVVTDDPTIFPFVDETQSQVGVYVQDQIRLDNLIVTLSAREDFFSRDPASSTKTSQDAFSYRAGVNYVFENGITPYVQASKSFSPLAGADFAGNIFEPTTGNQIEGGLKYDGRNLPKGVDLFASAAVYRITQENIATADPDHPGFNIQTGEVEVKGVEVEAAARIYERLSLNAAFTYTDTEVTKSNTANLGKELRAVPRTVASFLADYTFQTGPLAGFGAGVGVRYRGKQFGDVANTFESEAITLFDAIVHYDVNDWRFSVNASNFTDKKFIDRCSSTANCFYGSRRLITGTITRRF
ncbi:TonB-dependent siderophore receptor [Hyphococcus sp. DH-69]|uniref:TonB-dependent siderophore receptor n=1 Tax=Hyphococcus formosus TaxID=3143534 RepID=UPI00398A5139